MPMDVGVATASRNGDHGSAATATTSTSAGSSRERRRCEPGTSIVSALGLGLAYSLFVGILYVTSWRAFCRILRGRNEWFKTRRNAEFLTDIESDARPRAAGGMQVIHEIMGGSS